MTTAAVLLTETNEKVERLPRGVRALTVHQVVNFGAGRGLSPWAVYSTAAAREHKRYDEALAILLPSLPAAAPRDVDLVSAVGTWRETVPLNDTHAWSWFGPLCFETAELVTRRLNDLLGGQRFTVVTSNSYSEDTERFSAVDVRTGSRLTRPVELTQDAYQHISLHNTGWVMGVMVASSVRTRAHAYAARDAGSKHDWVHFTFEGSQVTIDHYAPAGYRLQWIFRVEHPEDDG